MKKWKKAMGKEYKAINENTVWKVVQRQKLMKVIPTMWVNTKKEKKDGTEKFKARLVARVDLLK